MRIACLLCAALAGGAAEAQYVYPKSETLKKVLGGRMLVKRKVSLGLRLMPDPRGRGMLVVSHTTAVPPHGPRRGEIITGVNNRAVRNGRDLLSALGGLNPGRNYKMAVSDPRRGGPQGVVWFTVGGDRRVSYRRRTR